MSIEIDKRVTIALGNCWHEARRVESCDKGNYAYKPDIDDELICFKCDESWPIGTDNCNKPYSTNIADAWEMEEEIIKRGLSDKYIYELMEILDMGFSTSPEKFMVMIHATPEQRSLAFLKTMGNSKQ